jgi:hypothetical protein
MQASSQLHASAAFLPESHRCPLNRKLGRPQSSLIGEAGQKGGVCEVDITASVTRYCRERKSIELKKKSLLSPRWRNG